uniref:Uncharacterized protein n=1 Tax=Sphaerodactylus townsendi TaxID=933632 RepID=A0ACB8EG15_9SAUR
MRYFNMAVSQPGQGLPWFTIVGYVDDQLIAYYDSNTRRTVPGVPWMEKVVQYEPGYWDRQSQMFQGNEAVFRVDLETLRTRYNQSHGVPAPLSFSTLCSPTKAPNPDGGHQTSLQDCRCEEGCLRSPRSPSPQ